MPFRPTSSDDDPPRAQVLKWLRINFTLMVAIGGLICSGVTGLVVGTLRFARYDGRLETAERVLRERGAWIDTQQDAAALLYANRMALEREVHDDTRRIAVQEDVTSQTVGRRLKLADDLATINARLAVVETKEVLVGDFVRNNVVLLPHPLPRIDR